jgi:hypothetical protein
LWNLDKRANGDSNDLVTRIKRSRKILMVSSEAELGLSDRRLAQHDIIPKR